MSFDLNINNYKIEELAELFELTSNNYDIFTIERKEHFLKENILSDKSIKEETKQRTISFLKEVKDILIATVSSKLSKIYNTDLSLKGSVIKNAGNTNIIDKPVTPYGQSFPSEFYKGIINPLKKRTIRQNLNIDTRFRNNYLGTTASDFQFELPTFFTDVLSVQLDAFELSSSFYNISINLGNNFFVIGLNTGNHYTIVLMDGTYNVATLISAINIAMPAIPELNDVTAYKIVLSTDVGGHAIFTNIGVPPSGPTYEFTLNFQTSLSGMDDFNKPLPLKLGWILGYRLGLYTDSSSFISEGSIDIYGPKYIYLVFDDYNNSVNNGFFSAFNSSVLNKNILARMSVNATANAGPIVQNNLAIITGARQYFGPVDIRKVHIQLIDEFGRVLDMHNMDYSFCVTFNIVYDL